jgi:hypothetical protein
MKKLVLLICLLITGSVSMAQSIAATTEEEFNMASVGYKMYLQMGVEIKKGYKITDIKEFEYGDRKATIKGLYRPGETKPCALIMVYSFRTSLAGETDNKQEQLQFIGFALGKASMFFATQ